MKRNIAVLGAGAWGTALACIAARAGHQVKIWCRDSETETEINQKHRNSRYLGDLPVEPEIRADNDIIRVLDDADLIIMAVPAQAILGLARSIAPIVRGGTPIVSAAKGIDRETGLLPTQNIASAIPGCPTATLSGPSFAHDVVRNLPTAVTVASDTIERATELSQILSNNTLRCYASDDVTGAELGGALKNVLALAVGAARGMELGASAEAALIARGFSEITAIAVKLGAHPATLTGLSGLGDIVLTCSSPQSRNFSYGVAMGRNQPLTGLKLAEGAFTAKIAEQIAAKEGVNSPIISAVTAVLDGRLSAREAVANLLQRPLKPEKSDQTAA